MQGVSGTDDGACLDEPDKARRLAEVLRTLRALPPVVCGDRTIRTEWSSPLAPFEGCMRHSRPIVIQLNPREVLKFKPGKPTRNALLGYLKGVTLHELSHVQHTPIRWHRVLMQSRRNYEKRAGLTLSERMLLTIANWCEDGYIERAMGLRFPGFITYFIAANEYIYNARKVKSILRDAAAMDKRMQSATPLTPLPRNEAAQLIQATMRLLGLHLSRPDVPVTPLPFFRPITFAARLLHQAAFHQRVGKRMRLAVEATALVQGLLRPYLPQQDGAADIDAVVEADMGKGLPNRRRDSGAPTETEMVASADLPSRRLSAAVAALLESEDAASESVSGATVSPNALPGAASGEWRLTICDATPDTLTHFPFFDSRFHLHEYGATIRRTNADSIAQMRRTLKLPLGFRTARQYGRKAGELDEDEIALVVTGTRDVFFTEERTVKTQLDLSVLLDMSGSMHSDLAPGVERWQMAAVALVGLEAALRSRLRSGEARLRVYGHTAAPAAFELTLFRLFDNAIPRLATPQRLAWGIPQANNADGFALALARRELQKTRADVSATRFLLMISDGTPSAHQYGGQTALAHVRDEVEATLRSDVRFAHLQIGEETGDDVLQTMYADAWRRVSVAEGVPEAVAALFAQMIRRR